MKLTLVTPLIAFTFLFACPLKAQKPIRKSLKTKSTASRTDSCDRTASPTPAQTLSLRTTASSLYTSGYSPDSARTNAGKPASAASVKRNENSRKTPPATRRKAAPASYAPVSKCTATRCSLTPYRNIQKKKSDSSGVKEKKR